MKIAFVCPYDYFRPGGVQNHIRSIARALVVEGHDVTVIAPRIAGNEGQPENGVTVTLVGSGRRMNFNKTQMEFASISGQEKQKLKRWLSEQKIDVFHFHTPWASIMSLQLLSWSKGSARIATFHDTPPDTFSGAVTRKVFKVLSFLLYRYLDRVIAVSEAPARHLHKSSQKPIHIVPPCFDLSPPTIISRHANETRVRIFFVGRLEPRKGVADLIRAFLLLTDEGLPIHLTIAGDGDELDSLKALAGKHLGERIVFLEAVSDQEKNESFSHSDIFCAPALYGESFGIVLVEAMNSSLPVLGGDNFGYRSVLQEKSDTCLFKPGDVSNLAQKLKKLVLDENLRKELGEWGQMEAEKYDCKNWLQPLLEHYNAAIKVKAAG